MISTRFYKFTLLCKSLSICLLSIGTAYAYNLPEVYVDSVGSTQANRQADYIEESLNNLDADIDSNVAEINTLQLEVDILRFWADTLKLEVDTLRDRVDLLESSRDSICFIYDAGGGQGIAALSAASILIDTEVFKDGIYTHAADVCSVGVSSPGRYEISYSISFEVTDNSKLGAADCYLRKYSGSWSNIPGGRAIDGWLADSRLYFSVSKTVQCTLSVDDAVAIYVSNGAIETAISTIANSVSLGLKKLH